MVVEQKKPVLREVHVTVSKPYGRSIGGPSPYGGPIAATRRRAAKTGLKLVVLRLSTRSKNAQSQNQRCREIRARQLQQSTQKEVERSPGVFDAGEPMDIDSSPPPTNEPLPQQSPPRHPRMEEVPDDTSNDPISSYDPRYLHRQPYPVERKAGWGQWKEKTPFEEWFEQKELAGEDACSPFPALDDWDLGRWLVRSGLSQGSIDEFLHLKTVREKLDPPFATSRAFFKHIDALPTGPAWMCTPMTVAGDEIDADGKGKVEVIELWHRNPLECIAELLGNPVFKEDQVFKPMRLFRQKDSVTGELRNREYDEMWTGTWWWDTQDLLDDGATIIPVILSSDKTQLSSFAGDKQAWPVYISIGNISKSVRRQPNSRATVLLGYIPVPKLDCYSKSARKKSARIKSFTIACRRCLKLWSPLGRRVSISPALMDGFDGASHC
ncbi:hypothetical protein MIND_00184500 [Mycena indigotica]|uniref:Uncharacterized protein n=1 Tax=Mycena indigotica TaxID=2126181 RepID=A0A8H6T4T5_9AGAR|nr:uncharacterized protein MIND_00184500 [Mycena indigotica]KAF7311743.1 hypothetical protein MIND_00184500 [Mycena indigotica]